MASSLVSPGVSVTIEDTSFYIPASAPTVPLIFLATQSNKTQPDGVTPATGTQESNVVRTVTSIGQSAQLYGIPKFRADVNGNQFHGDARNEYGLFALNQFLTEGNLAYVVRANIDLADAAQSFYRVGTPIVIDPIFTGVGDGDISSVTVTGPQVKPGVFNIVFTDAASFYVESSTLGTIGLGTVDVPFTSAYINFTIDAGTVDFVAGDYFSVELAYAPSTQTGTGNGTMTRIVPGTGAVAETITVTFTSATAFTVSGGTSGPLGTGTVGTLFSGSGNHISFLITAGSTPFAVGDVFTLVLVQTNVFNPLGATDADRRESIVTALQAVITSNTDVRSELYEYNLIVCPGYWEVIPALLSLASAVEDEAFVIADTPSTMNSEQAAVWGNTTARANSTNVAYYHPWCLAPNLDGVNVVVAPAGTALAVYAKSDNESYVWFAPAGANRGVITGVNDIGYVTGTLGGPTTFVPLHPNQGQRDVLYKSPTNINPIAYFTGRGILMWGQKTSSPVTSALDRVNAARCTLYIKRQLRKGSFPFVFEPNDSVTQGNLKGVADAFLNGIMAKRGLIDFVTLCDKSNNTPTVLANNELWMDVAIQLTPAAEFVIIPIRVLSASATNSGLPG